MPIADLKIHAHRHTPPPALVWAGQWPSGRHGGVGIVLEGGEWTRGGGATLSGKGYQMLSALLGAVAAS